MENRENMGLFISITPIYPQNQKIEID